MSAEVLRKAARLMRQRAEAATQGVWVHTYGGIFVNPERRDLGMSYDAVVAEEGDDDEAEPVTYMDAEHIASWHPVVALAVADVLDRHVDRIEATGFVGHGHDTLLALAFAYLGSEAS